LAFFFLGCLRLAFFLGGGLVSSSSSVLSSSTGGFYLDFLVPLAFFFLVSAAEGLSAVVNKPTIFVKNIKTQ